MVGPEPSQPVDPFDDITIHQGFTTQYHGMADVYLGGPALEILLVVIPSRPTFEMIVVVSVASVAREITNIGDVKLKTVNEDPLGHVD